MPRRAENRLIKQARAAKTRMEILEAGIDLFAKRGILATTMNELARAIKMTPGALYWHFPTKEDLLLAAMEEMHRRFLGEFTEVLTEGRKWTARKQLSSILERSKAFFRYHPTHGVFFGIIAAEAPHNSPRVAEAVREILGNYVMAVENIVRYGQKKGEFRADIDASQFAHAMMSAHLAMSVHQQLNAATLSYEALCEALDAPIQAGFRINPSGT